MPILERVRFGSGHRERFLAWWRSEIQNTLGDRAALDAKWADEIVQWRAALPKGEKDFPWPGASNLVFPLTAMHSDPVYADFMQTLHAAPEYWGISALKADRAHHAMPFQEFLRGVERNFIKMRQVNGRALLDNNILGTSIYKSHWLHERVKVRDYDPADVGSRKIIERVKVRSHPSVEAVPLQHFYIPADAWAIDPDAPIGGARWVAQEIHLTKAQLIRRAEAESPFMPGYDKAAVAKVIAFESQRENTVDAAVRAQEQYTPWDERRIRLFEVWARFDVDGDDVEEDVVSVIHHESNTELRTLYNPFLHGKRPFYRTRYLPTFGFYGLGMAESDKWAQLTVSKLLNAQIDNVTLANTRMYSAPLGSGVQPGEPIYPGKIWFVGPNEQIGEVKLGEIYPSLPATIGQLMQYAEMRTGVSELRQGNLSGLPSRTPATSLLSILREGNKRFDLILSDFREVHGEIGLQVAQNVAQWYQEDPLRWQTFCVNLLGEEDAMKVIEVLSASVHDMPETFGVAVTATSAMVNKEVEKQGFIGLIQLTRDIYQSLIQTAQIIPALPPGTPAAETATAAFRSGVELLGQLLQRFDIQNPRDYLGNLEAIAAGMQSMQPGGVNPLMAPMMGGMPGMSGMGGGAPAGAPGAGGGPMVDPAMFQGDMGALLGFGG